MAWYFLFYCLNLISLDHHEHNCYVRILFVYTIVSKNYEKRKEKEIRLV